MSDSTTKRRLITQLPAVNQTADLAAFFGATVDEVFQPGQSEAINGYIGHQIAGSSAFYVAEPNRARAFYQLEPAMLSYDATATTTIDYALVYPHLVSYLAITGGLVSNQQRLFETNYYAWAPPINIDMLVNYGQYYWFGDVTVGNFYSFNPSDQTSAITLANGGISAQWPSASLASGPQAVRSTVLDSGSWYIEITILSGTADQAVGVANTIDPIDAAPGSLASGNNAVVYASDGNVYNDTGSAISTLTAYGPNDVIGIAWNTVTRSVWFRLNGGVWNNGNANPSTDNGGFDLTSLLANGPVQAVWTTQGNDSQVDINFGTTAFNSLPPNGFAGPATVLPSADLPTLTLTVPTTSYIGDGTTTTFALPDSIAAVLSDAEMPTVYVNDVAVAVRHVGHGSSHSSAQAFSGYTGSNSFAYAGGTSSATAVPPTTITVVSAPATGASVVVYRTPDLAAAITGATTVNIAGLNNQGVTWLTSSMRIKIVDAVHQTDAWDDQAWDISPWDAAPGAVYFVDGVGQSIRLTDDATMIRGLEAQYLTIDRSTIDRETNGWALRNSWVHKDSFAWSGAQFPTRQANRPIIEFIRDLTRYPQQTWSESAAPLFMLYDLNGNALNNQATYPSSTFAGNRLFGYATGSTFDDVLELNVSYDNNGYLLFSNDSANQSYTYLLGTTSPVITPIAGLFQYTTTNADSSLNYTAFWHPASVPTVQTVDATTGFYNIPNNLQANPDYEEVDQISQATWTTHFDEIIANQIGVSGLSAGDNNYRDTLRDLTLGTQIVQHVAPLLKTMLLAATGKFDFIEAVRYVELEYNRFRNKFVRKLSDLSNRGVLQTTDDPMLWVSTTLAALKIGHTNSFPFALSTMAGGQYFIPSTPTALGLLPSAIPMQVSDTTHAQPITLLIGHDGSLTPAFGDWRDAVLLALETQIYQSLPSQFQTETRPTFDIQNWIGGRFYAPTNGYSYQEVSSILAPIFELWAQINNFDYRSNTTYDAGNPFTWNFRGVADRFGNILPGNWRAIYRYYYDTDAPHTRPWEMLGFAGEPIWWEETYGAAPYLRSNTQLWDDLAAGLIRNGPRAGIAPRYARPGLLDLIPVDHAGNLLDPIATGIVTANVTYQLGIRDWIAGDDGPVESLWFYSPSSRYGLIQASFLMKPARFVEQGWDSHNIGFVNDQWVMLDSLERPRNSLQYVHGEINPSLLIDPFGVALAITGISQWLADYLLSSGSPSSVLGNAVRGLEVALLHQMAGFVPADTVQLVADSFGLLPTQDVQTILYTSPAVSSEVYSGVIIEWTGSAWQVIGYDGRNPSFTVIPPNTTGARGLISLAGASEPAIVPWRNGTYYPINILVAYQNSVYECKTANISTTVFEQSYWTPRPDLSTNMITAPRVVTYANGLPTTVNVPYGTQFSSYQDVANFLLGWERWLVSRGWSFTNLDTGSNQILNWSLSVEEFLSWAQVQWAPGNFIALSPGQSGLQFSSPQGTILNVEDNVTGFYGLLNRSGQPISQRNAVITRLNSNITLEANSADIFLARLEICNIEHALVPNNVTLAGDDVYLPLFNLRQQRLSLTCNRAMNWAGRLDAPGFIITNNTLASSFEKASNDVRLMFDIELADVPTLRDYARHDVGFQQRAYFNNLLLSPNNQFEFYQGMIQEKGTPGVFEKLTRSTLVASPTSSLQFLEEWAFRVGVFGAPLHPFVTFQLIQDAMRDDPQFISFTPQTGAPLDWIEMTTDDSRWYDLPDSFTNFFPEQADYAAAALPTAGPVRLSDVQFTVFNSTDVPDLYDANSNTLPTGTMTWVYNSTATPIGTTWYVNASTGNDSNAGTQAAPFASLQQAHDVSNPGDVIYVAGGLNASGQLISYTAATGTNVLEIARSGTASAPITYQAVPGTRPIITGSQSTAAVHFNAVAYVNLLGFEIIGWNATLDLAGAQAATIGDDVLPLYNGSGIVIDRGITVTQSHHLRIDNCLIHDFPNSGIIADWTDYITIQNCTVYHNGLYSSLAGTGINVLNSHDFDTVTTHKTFVMQNICYGNDNLITNQATGSFTGGQGIVITDNLNTATDGQVYAGRTLVANNLCYGNGGNGILLVTSDHVDTIYNTTYQNQTNLNNPNGEIVSLAGSDNNVANNIIVALSSFPLSAPTDSSRYLNNLSYGGNGDPLPGISSFTDPLFVNATNNQFSVLQGSVAIDAASQQFTVMTDLLGNVRNAITGYDIGCYQSGSSPAEPVGSHPFDVLNVFDIGPNGTLGVQPNAIQIIVVPGITASATVDPTLVTTRIFFNLPMTLTTDDIGNYLVIDGAALTSPELQGVQVITGVYIALNAIDIETVCSVGNDFSATPTTAPLVRVLRSMRFPTVAAINPDYIFVTGDVIWIDNYNIDPMQMPQWAVLSLQNNLWSAIRQQPRRVDSTRVSETVIYNAGAQLRNNNQMILNQPVVDDVDVIDPMVGLIQAICTREISYQLEYDPANYNAGYGNLNNDVWGANQVGRVWWNLATVAFLDPYTDTLGISASRDITELQYRINNWAQVAPNSSVDVYEWTVSTVDPITYTATAMTGTVYNAAAPSWVETSVYDPILKQDVTHYYFWVSGLTVVPALPFRQMSISDVASGIANPSVNGNAWMSPISAFGLLISGVTTALNETSTVMKVSLNEAETVGQNDEWLLMRPTDETSLPTDPLWDAMRDGLAGFQVDDDALRTVPDPALTVARNTGIYRGQSMFQMSASPVPAWQPQHVYYYGDLVALGGFAYQCVIQGTSGSNGPTGYSSTISDGTMLWAYHGADGSRSGLLDARAAFIGSVNNIFATTAIWLDRTVSLENIIGGGGQPARITPIGNVDPTTGIAYLTWMQSNSSYAYEPPPSIEWDVPFEVHSLSERNDLLGSLAFQYTSSPLWTISTVYAVGDQVINAGNAYQCITGGLSGATAPTGTQTVSDGGATWLWLAALVNDGGPISVLLSGFASIVPQWSIWVFNPSAARNLLSGNPLTGIAQRSAWAISTLISNANQVFTLKTAYEYSVPNIATLNGLHVLDGQRVLVTADTQGFWTIYQWQQASSQYVLWRAQTYNAASFIETVDWYDTATLAANNYSISDPPIVSYATESERNATEGANPANYFVNITNSSNGNGSFIWTAFIGGSWQTVAIGKGTIALSQQFVNPSNVLYGISTVSDPQPLNLANIQTRDGSWEMRVLVQALRYSGLLLNSEINQLWFDMVNFVHVQQNEVDWAFKTSFIDLFGINVPLVESPVQTVDQTDNITDYINEVKPYRVKIRETVVQYSPPMDQAITLPIDFDNPQYLDPTTNTYRGLDPTNAQDIKILQTEPWSYWYDNYLIAANLVRNFEVTLLFDRLTAGIGNWDMSPWDSTNWDIGEEDSSAAFRIITYYQPTAGMPPNDVTALLGLAEKENQDDGGTFTPESKALDINPGAGFATTPDTDINPPLPSRPGGYDLRAPYYAANSPEERIPLHPDDALQLTVTAQPLAGAPSHAVKLFDVGAMLVIDPSATTVTLNYELIAQSAFAIMVFCDGVRAVIGTDYTVDQLDQTITLNTTVNGNPVDWVLIHAFGLGATSPILEQHYLSYGTDSLTLNETTPVANVAVIVNGDWVATGQFNVSGTTVSLTSPPSAGSDVILLVFASPNTAILMQTQRMTYTTGAQVWTLTNPDLQTVPSHGGTLVEVNGRRLTPPQTFYGTMSSEKRWLYLPVMPSSTAIQVYYQASPVVTAHAQAAGSAAIKGWSQPLATAHGVSTALAESHNSASIGFAHATGLATVHAVSQSWVKYTATIPTCVSTSAAPNGHPFNLIVPTGETPSTSIAGQFVLFDNMLVSLDANFSSADVVVVLTDSTSDYTVAGSTLTISKTLTANDVVQVTTFDHAGAIGIQTVTYSDDSGQYLIPHPAAPSYTLVTMNGAALALDSDYAIFRLPHTETNVSFMNDTVSLSGSVTGPLVMTVFTALAAREEMTWMVSTITPASTRMTPLLPNQTDPNPLVQLGFDAQSFDSDGFDEGIVSYPVGQFSLTGGFEAIRLSLGRAGLLVNDLGMTDETIVIDLFAETLSPKLQAADPLPLPIGLGNPTSPKAGVIWIENERIEYFGYSRTDDVVTLSGLRRATRGTSMGTKRLVITALGDGTSHSYTFAEAGTADVTIDGVLISSQSYTVNGTSVTLTAAVGVYVVIGMTLSASHLAGVIVYNGAQVLDQVPPIEPRVGNRELYPMHAIITG